MPMAPPSPRRDVETLVYTLPGCTACGKAKRLLADMGEPYREVAIDNPLVEIGVRSLFRDDKIHAPVVLRPHRGAFVMSPEGRLVKLVLPHQAVAA